jgi:hypothetical protein
MKWWAATTVEHSEPAVSPRDDRKEREPHPGIVPDLAGVSETMLWSLHNRASEARRPDGVLADPESVRMHSAINYDFAGHFGDPLGSLAARAVRNRPSATVVARAPSGRDRRIPRGGF